MTSSLFLTVRIKELKVGMVHACYSIQTHTHTQALWKENNPGETSSLVLSSVSPPLQCGWVVSICQLSVPASDTESCHFSSAGIGEAFCSCLAWLGAKENVHGVGWRQRKKKRDGEASQGAGKQVKWRQLKRSCRGDRRQDWTNYKQHRYAISGPDQPLLVVISNCSNNTIRCLCHSPTEMSKFWTWRSRERI